MRKVNFDLLHNFTCRAPGHKQGNRDAEEIVAVDALHPQVVKLIFENVSRTE